MKENHPLTSEMVQDIWNEVAYEKSGGFTQDDLMRAAADWQLEQVIEWLKDELDYDPNLLLDLKEAMRPQENS